MKLKDINFGTNNYRIQSLFLSIGIETIDELIKYSAKDILKFRNVGKLCINDIQTILCRFDKRLATERDSYKINKNKIKEYYEQNKIPKLLIDINDSIKRLNNQISILRTWLQQEEK